MGGMDVMDSMDGMDSVSQAGSGVAVWGGG